MFTTVLLNNYSDKTKIADNTTVKFKVLVQILNLSFKQCFSEFRLKSIDVSCSLLSNCKIYWDCLHGTLVSKSCCKLIFKMQEKSLFHNHVK